MKKIIITLLGIAIAGTNAMAQCDQVSCPLVTLSGTLANRTLDADSTYLLSGCVIVPDNMTITAQAGVVVMGAPNSALYFEKGSEFISQGTEELPVIFTSDRVEGCKAPGDWGGIILGGNAPNNNNNSITLNQDPCTSIVGGGIDPNDYSGILKYMRIEYATTGLTMVSVGDATEMHNIQISYAAKNGLDLYGGTVKFKELVFLNNYGTDILATHGNLSLGQRILTVRLDPTAHVGVSPYSNSIVFKNNEDTLNNYEGYLGSNNTHPIFSNVTILGPEYCGDTAHGDIKNGLLFTNNTEGEIYNSYIDGYPTGFRIEELKTAENANRTASPGPSIFFEYNSFYNNSVDDYSTDVIWPSGCTVDIGTWLSGGTSCRQEGIETGNPAGYSSTVCSSYVSTIPDFSLTTSSLSASNYSPDALSNNDDFFEEMNKRGAFDATDWTEEWTNWNPKGIDYCSLLRVKNPTRINKVGTNNVNLAIAPNPASGVTYATFTTAQAGKVNLTLVNSIGQTVRTISQDMSKGNQQIAIPTNGLNAGVYMVNLTLSNGSAVRGKVVVK